MSSSPLSRRSFLQGSATAAAGLAVSGLSPGNAHGANDAIQVGLIGVGGRCRQLLPALTKIPGVRITAVCDIWDVNLDQGKKLADRRAFATKDYRALLDSKDIDAVLIATPDHWHVPMTVAACEAGKTLR